VADLSELQAQLRRDLGLRPETRLDHVIFMDGTTWELQPDGIFKQVSRG
jgi:hypothetical protein